MSDGNSQEFWKYVENLFCEQEMFKNLAISNDNGMLKSVKSVFNWAPSTSNNDKRFKKSSAKSMKYAKEAIKAANNRERSRSMKLANMITAFAQDAGDLALGHSIRFQILSIIQTNYLQMIKELELCLKIPEPPKKMDIWIQLKLSGEDGFVSPNLDRNQLTELLEGLKVEKESPETKKHFADEKEQEEKNRKFTRDLFTIKSPNPMAPALEDFVEIKYDSVKGRHLVVTKDVPAGTTLSVEKPYICGLADVFYLEISHCHNCFREEFVPIPCPNCVFVLYCCEKCLEESKEFHKKYECSVFPILYDILSSIEECYRGLSAYSTICTFGPHQLFRAFQREQKEENQEESSEENSESKSKSGDHLIPGFDPETGIYDPCSFYTISQMNAKSHCSRTNALISLALTKILKSRTVFFLQLESQLTSPSVKTAFQDFITLSLVNLRNSYSSRPISQPKYFDDPKTIPLVYAFSHQPTSSLSNHSCQQNAGFFFTQFNVKGLGTATVATRDLKKGAEVCRNYYEPFFMRSKSLRQKILSKEFDFKCECVACFNNWPLWEVLLAEKDHPKFCCSSCSLKIPPQPQMMTKKNFDKIALNSGTGNGNNLICPQCKSEYKEEELMTKFNRNSMALDIARKLIDDGKGPETLKSLKTASAFFKSHLIPPSYYQETCENLIIRSIKNSLND